MISPHIQEQYLGGRPCRQATESPEIEVESEGGGGAHKRTEKKAKHIFRHCSLYCDIHNNQCI